MATYTVQRVSSEEPRQYYSEKYNTTTYYIKVMLEGHAKPVSIGKKTANALKQGDTVNGTIVPTEFDTDNFKAESKTFTPVAGRDQEGIKAQWAIGQAVQLFTSGKDNAISDIEKNAKDFFGMVERVKGGQVSITPSLPAAKSGVAGYDQAKEKAEKIRQEFSDGSPLPPVEEAINPAEIPF